MSNQISIEGREYKLLLDPKKFRGAPTNKAAAALWKKLKEIIDDRLDKKDGGTRAEGALKRGQPRHVAYLDTRERLLYERDFALRVRADLNDGKANGKPKATLKYRSPDVLLATDYRRIVTADEPLIEEDISPLQVARSGKPVAVADQRSLYSRFAISTERVTRAEFQTIEQVVDKFNWLDSWLDRRTDGGYRDEKLHAGPTICEWVFEDASVWLGDGIRAKFTLTLWYLHKNAKVKSVYERALSGDLDPRIAEISFDFGVDAAKGARMDAEAAERAAALFIGMQELRMDKRETSKTKLGLPDRK